MIVSGIGPGDEVLLPTLTYVAPANAVRWVGAYPVFLDVESQFRQLDVGRAGDFMRREYRQTDGELRNRRSGRRLKAILAVDLLGHPCDMKAVMDLATSLGLQVIEDAAEALGAKVGDRMAGSLAPVSILSFNANKMITTGGGGMLLCHDDKAAGRARSLASHAKVPGSAIYQHDEVGFNYIMASAQAALGLSQLERFDEFLGRKRAIAARYAEAFDDEPTITVPQEANWAFASHWLYTIHVPTGAREALIDSLAQDGIETRPIFECMHRVIAHRKAQADDCPVAEELSDTGICLPCSTDLEDPELDEVAGAVLSALAVADVDRS